MSRTEAVFVAILVGLLLVLGLIVSGQAEQLVELYTVAQQEPPSPGHEGQPDHCTNAKGAPKSHKCECKKEASEMGCKVEDVKCKVYCRKHKCYCWHEGCDS